MSGQTAARRAAPTNLFLALPDDLGRGDASGDAAGDGQGGPLLQRAQHPVRGALPAHPQHGLARELHHVQAQVGPAGGGCGRGRRGVKIGPIKRRKKVQSKSGIFYMEKVELLLYSLFSGRRKKKEVFLVISQSLLLFK